MRVVRRALTQVHTYVTFVCDLSDVLAQARAGFCPLSSETMLLSRLIANLKFSSDAAYNVLVFVDGQQTAKLVKHPRHELTDLLFAAVRDQLAVKEPRLFIGTCSRGCVACRTRR